MYNMEDEFVKITSVKFDAGDFHYNFSNYGDEVDDKALILSYKDKDSEAIEISIYNTVVIRALRDFINQNILNE